MLKIFPNASARAQKFTLLPTKWARLSPIPNPIASFHSRLLMLSGLPRSPLLMSINELNDNTGDALRPPPSRDSRSICDGRRPKPRNDRRPRVPAQSMLACARTSPPHRSNCPRWRASEHSSARAGCSRAFPSRCVLRSVMHCGPTLSRTPTHATRTPSQVPSPSRFFAAWCPRTAARARTTVAST